MHSCCQFLEVLDTGVKEQLDKLVGGDDTLLGEEVMSCVLNAAQHKLALETEPPSLWCLTVHS